MDTHSITIPIHSILKKRQATNFTAKLLLSLITFIGFYNEARAQDYKLDVIIADVENFWIAYDRVCAAKDSVEKIRLINELYINRGTQGLKDMMRVREYEDYEFVAMIEKYPKYWASIRGNMNTLVRDKAKIEEYLAQLKLWYPPLKSVPIYFVVGAFRSAGTYTKDGVLFGAEFMLANENSDISELPERIQWGIKNYTPYNIPLTAMHEFVHTAQNKWEDQTILHLSIGEGVAEYVSTVVTGEKESLPVRFGKENADAVMKQYMREILRDDDVWNWLWGNNTNHLKMNDLAYYIGYEFCERYMATVSDKRAGIKRLIEFDYTDPVAFANFIDSTRFLPNTIAEIDSMYEAQRPFVARVLEFNNGSIDVDPSVGTITLEFSEPMSTCCRGFDLVEDSTIVDIKISEFVGWSEDMKRYTLKLSELKSNTTYGIVITSFAKQDGGNRIAPYRLTFRTKGEEE